MKKLIISVFLLISISSLAACGFGGSCDMCGGSSLLSFNYPTTTCCSTTPW
ncbi:hypothetical protein [Legionella nagasakiensis]|uniref:hypothetical protein n=1 Tax=Legionella nagasakiensis TaxID=535290 RepID=UPI0013EF7A2B|nr:hypothetical protein [Legionella nagasakiensis]